MILAILALLAVAVLLSVRGIRAESRATTCWDPVVEAPVESDADALAGPPGVCS